MKKVAIVTGASAGIGKATALELHKAGFIVYAGARRLEKMNDLKEKGIHVQRFDVTKEEDCKSLVNTVLEREGRVDVLVNNAGYGHFGTMEESSIERGRAMFETNLFGLVRMSQLVIPQMRKQKYGKIVNLSSIGGKMTTPFSGWYQSTKYAIECVSNAFRMEIQQFGIDVIIIEPGLIETEFFDITYGPLKEISGSGPYAKSCAKMTETMKESYKGATPPSVIGDTIVKAVNAKKPKTRYVKGKQGASTLFAAKVLGDRGFDKMVTGMTMEKE